MGLVCLEDFDLSTLEFKASAWRHHYERLLKRYSDQARFVEADYGFGDKRIETHFIEANYSNAHVRRTESGYNIRIASTFPYLLKALFSRVLADPEVMDWLPYESVGDVLEQEVYFSTDSRDIGNQSFVQQETTLLRDKVATILSDIAMEFVFLHELGHILGGHVESQPQKRELSELSLTRQSCKQQRTLNRVWEFEADMIAANLLKSYAGTLIKTASATSDPDLRAIFGPPQFAVEQCTSLSVIACYVLFRYLRETSSRLDLKNNHPDPLVRAACVRNTLFSCIAERHKINQELFEDMLSARFEEFDDVLEQNGIHAGMVLTDERLDDVNIAVAELHKSRSELGHKVAPYRYFNWP
ncbi:MAG TPA: hypothetical protein DCS30_14025 [Rhizobiales bacterium]|nr:hypothetical protein [Hyphomicrobiales bacterium]